MRRPLAVIAGLGALLGLLSGQLTAPAPDPAPTHSTPRTVASGAIDPEPAAGSSHSAPATIAWTFIDASIAEQAPSRSTRDAAVAPTMQTEVARGPSPPPQGTPPTIGTSDTPAGPTTASEVASTVAKTGIAGDSPERAQGAMTPSRSAALQEDAGPSKGGEASPGADREPDRVALPAAKDRVEAGPPPIFENATQYRVTAAPGDTLSGLLTAAGLERAAAQQAVAALRPHFNPRDLRAGQEIIVHLGQPSALSAAADPKDDDDAADLEEGAGGSVLGAITALVGDWRARGAKPPETTRAAGSTGSAGGAAPPADEPGVTEPAADDDSREGLAVLGFTVRDGETREIYVVRSEEGFSAHEGRRKLERRVLLAEGTIRTSFYVAATGSGVPPSVVANAIRTLSFDVDFQREIQEGNRYQFLYDVLVDAATGALVRGGDLLFIGMALDSRVVRLYRHRPDGFPSGYFDAEGRSVKRALMRTPIDGARLTSGYGMRRHPVLGFGTMHRGVDFAAPVGTPVYAAGAGLIEKAGWFAAYGRYVRVQHEGRFATAYAHLSRIPDHIQEGRQVRQGDVIGYVGASGRATGPHLHYEVLRDGAQVNPAFMRMPTAAELSGEGLQAFHAERERIDNTIETVAGPTLASGRVDGDRPARRVVMIRASDL